MTDMSVDQLYKLFQAWHDLQGKSSKPESEVSAVDHATECPDCYRKIIEKLNGSSQFACADCGLPLGNEAFVKKLESCPNCGKSNVKAVNRWR